MHTSQQPDAKRGAASVAAKQPQTRRARVVLFVLFVACVVLSSGYVAVGMFSKEEANPQLAEQQGRQLQPLQPPDEQQEGDPSRSPAKMRRHKRKDRRRAGEKAVDVVVSKPTPTPTPTPTPAPKPSPTLRQQGGAGATSTDPGVLKGGRAEVVEAKTEPPTETNSSSAAASEAVGERIRFTSFADGAAYKLVQGGINGPTKGGVANETGTPEPPPETNSSSPAASEADVEKNRFAPFADSAANKLVEWGIGGPAKGGVANETSAAGYTPYEHHPQTPVLKRGQWVALERMLGSSAAAWKKGQSSIFRSLQPSYINHEAYYREKGCFGTCAQRGVAADVPAVNLANVTCKELPTLVPYNMLPTASEDLKVMKMMLACGIPFAYVRWTDGAGHVLRGSVRMATVLRGRMDAAMSAKVKKVAPNGWLRGAPLANLVRDTWLALNISHPRFMLGMPIPTCLEGMSDERFTGGTAALRWTDFYVAGGIKVSTKGALTRGSATEFFEGKYMPSLARWSYSSLFTHQNGAQALPMLRSLAKRKGTLIIASDSVKRRVRQKKLGWDVYAMPSELYLTWEGNTRADHIEKMVIMAKESKGRVFLCSFSAVCAIFFHRMWEVSQDNWYIVVGTALDALLGENTRSWIGNSCTKLGKECTMYRSTYHWGTWNGWNGGIIPHAAGSWTRKTGCSARQPFAVQFVKPALGSAADNTRRP
eukprot:CAMPEP_0181351942 /NCGR_PEP_ID=MMETSP1106-20121128/2050_1 /TAXON_ID=81844 /ORGANISM="Mantoniella antarctica, Strain SL-175" /LENGTH=706 /DNA_ID=CAMNT_0023464479 /DNA_START=121 /DNA_END=2242 /DNA_ORIENTATION=-